MNESLEYNYKEMVRLAEICDAFTKNAFDDIKMFGALGSLLVWQPVSKIILSIGGQNSEFAKLGEGFTFLGFIAILFIIAVIGITSLLKQSVIFFHLNELEKFETKIRQELGEAEGQTFRVAENWSAWYQDHHKPVSLIFFLLFYFILTVLPTCFLWGSNYAYIYLTASIATIVLHTAAVKIIHKKKHNQL